MDTADRFIQEILATANQHADLVRQGARVAESHMAPAIRNLSACYRKARKEGHEFPSWLDAAIENVIALLTGGANPYDERRSEPRYQTQCDGGTDIGPGGMPLRPGS